MTNKFIRAAEWLTDRYISLMLLVFPLFTGFQGYGNITRSKYLFFLTVTSLWLLALIGLILAARSAPRLENAGKIVLAFALWACVSSAASPFMRQSIVGASRYDGLLTLLMYVGIFLGVSAYGKWRKRYAVLLTVSAAGCIAVSLAQISGSTILFPNGYTYYDAGVLYVSKFLGTIGNTNLLAAFFCLVIPICAAADAFGWPHRGLMRLTALFGACLLSFTESSGGMVALAAAAAVCAPLLAARGVLSPMLDAVAFVPVGLAAGRLLNADWTAAAALLFLAALCIAASRIFRRVPTEKHCRIVLVLLAAAVFLSLLAVYFWPVGEGTIYELSQLLHGRVRDDFGSRRIQIWREALKLVPERPLLGGGPDTLALRIQLDFSRYFPALGQTLTTYTDNAHNVYLGYLVNLGLPGLLSYLALIALSLLRIFRSREAHISVLGGALICAWTENFFGLGLCLVAPVMWVLWGLLFSQEHTQKTTGVEQNEKANETDPDLYSACGDGDLLPDAEQAAKWAQQHRSNADTGSGATGCHADTDLDTDTNTDRDTYTHTGSGQLRFRHHFGYAEASDKF